MDSKKLALLCREFADDKKAENITILDVRELSSVTDYFVIASGTSEPHLRAITNEITDRLREEHELRPRAVDGALQTAWIVRSSAMPPSPPLAATVVHEVRSCSITST